MSAWTWKEYILCVWYKYQLFTFITHQLAIITHVYNIHLHRWRSENKTWESVCPQDSTLRSVNIHKYCSSVSLCGMRWTGMKRLVIRDNNVLIQCRKRQRRIQKATHKSWHKKKNYNFISNNDITLLEGRRESNDINLVLYADPAGTGTYKEHVHIYNTVLWLNR